MEKIHEDIICAGFGGQGILTLGKVIAGAGMECGLNVTWLPSYGAEVRGGTAHSKIRLNSDPIASPAVNKPDIVVAMNGPSLDRFQDKVKSGGLIILNTSLTPHKITRKDVEAIEVPLSDEAIKLGNVRVANMIVAGIIAGKRGIISKEKLISVIKKLMSKRPEFIPINTKAIERGIEIAGEK